MAKPLYGNTVENRYSSKDLAKITVELKITGEVYVTRFGQRAIIRSATKDKTDPYRIGGQPYWTPLPRAEGPQGVGPKRNKRHNGHQLPGIATEDIPPSCPYWHQVVDGLTYPKNGAAPVTRTSAYDGAQCLIYMKSDGVVCIKRKAYRIQLLPPF